MLAVGGQTPTLAHHVDPSLNRPAPPAPGGVVIQPASPTPAPAPVPPRPEAGPLARPMPPLVTLDGSPYRPSTDGVVNTKPPKPLKTG